MRIIGIVLTIPCTLLGTIAAIYTLAPEEVDITYSSLFSNTIFISGWLVAFASLVLTFYQEWLHSKNIKTHESRFDEAKDDKLYLRGRLEKTIDINEYLSMTVSGANVTAIPRGNKDEI